MLSVPPAADAATPASNAASSPVAAAADATDFPASVRSVALGAGEFASGGRHTLRFRLRNPDGEGAVLHVRLAPGADWITNIFPAEAALGPGEQQAVTISLDSDAGRQTVRGGGASSAPVRLLYQRLFAESGQAGEREAAVYVHLPVAQCPSCHKSLETLLAHDSTHSVVPEVCPFCFERLRACPVCGAPNSWRARVCVQDATHMVRAAPDWNALGGSAAHSGSRSASRPITGLARRWSFPNVPPARRENALAWSAPVAAYGLVAAGAASPDGDAHLYAFDSRTGAPLWEPYPLLDPIYPDRGGAAIAGGHLFAATVEGTCVCVDALRGTRVWEVALNERVYGAVVPAATAEGELTLLIPAANDEGTGSLLILRGENGAVQHRVTLSGPPDSAPAFAGGRAFVHDDSGILSAIDVASGAVVWSVRCGTAGFDAAPVVQEGMVISANSAGVVWCHNAETGETVWEIAVTNAPFGGTPASDGLLVYLPADDGVHLVSTGTGRAVRRYPTRLPVRSAPVVLGGALLFGATDGNIYGVLSAIRGLEKLYETGTVGSQIVAAPAAADGAFFVTATNGVLYALTLQEGGGERAG